MASHTFTITYSDGVSTATKSLQFVLAEQNDPPTGSSIGEKQTAENVAFSFTLPEYTDPDGDSLTYDLKKHNWEDVPDYINFDAATRIISGTPLADDNDKNF